MGLTDISRRRLFISGVVSGLIGAGVTGSSALNSVEGDASVQAQQAIELTGVTTGSADSDTSFTDIGDDDTSFGAAVELNNGDSTEIFIDLRNYSSAALKTRATIKQPSPLSISPRIADDDDLQDDNRVVQTGKDTYVFTIPAQRIVRFVLRISVPDTASPGASDVRISFDPLSTSKDEQPSTDSGPQIEDAKLFDTVDGDRVVSDGETVRVEATVTEFNGLKLVTTDATEFDPRSGPVTLTDNGPGVSQSDDKFSAEFVVGGDADEGTGRTVDIKATDNEGVETEETANSLVVRNVETDNDPPAISDVSLSDDTDSDGVVSKDDEVRVEATVEDAANAGEITEVTADASDFGAGTVTLYSSSPPSGNSDGGTRTESATFTVESDATEGTGQTVTLTVKDENGDKVTGVNAADKFSETLEVDNDAPTISDVSLSDVTDSDGVVSDGDRVRVEATVEDAANAGEITEVTADASAFGAGTVELSNTDTSGNSEASGGGKRTVSKTFTVGKSGTATEGGQTVTVTATDENGDRNETTTGTLIVDTQDPAIGDVILSSDGVSGVADVDDTVRVTAEGVSGTGSDIAEVKVDSNKNPFKGTEITLTDGGPGVSPSDDDYSKEFSLDQSDLTGVSGSQTLTVTVTDEAGNTKDQESNSLTVPPATGDLVSYWKLDSADPVEDYVGSNDGSVDEDTNGNVSFGSLASTGSSAANFTHNGSGDENGYIDCGSDSSLDVGNEFTISAYFKPADLSGNDDEGIVSRDTGGNGGTEERIWSLRVKGTTNEAGFVVHAENGGVKQAISGGIPDNNTYHAIGRFDGKNLDLSVKEIENDGTVRDTVTDGTARFKNNINVNQNSSVPLRIGFYYADNDRAMEGKIDEVKLFDTRLSDADVDALHTITE